MAAVAVSALSSVGALSVARQSFQLARPAAAVTINRWKKGGVRSYTLAGSGLTEDQRQAAGATGGAESKFEQRKLNQLFDLSGSTAFVTGGAQGIGAAIALGMAESGADVAVADFSNEDKLAEVVQKIRGLGRKATGVKCDVRDRAAVEAAVKKAAQELGSSPDILVASAGIIGHPEHATNVSHEGWSEVIATNLEGSYNAARAVYPYMKERGRGKVVFISSVAGVKGAGTQVAYACSKGALLPLTRSLCAAWGRDNIQVNVLVPGAINTPFLNVMLANPKKLEAILSRIPLGRLGVPAEMVGPALFLASHASDYVTGAEILVDGGGLSLPMLANQDPEAYKV